MDEIIMNEQEEGNQQNNASNLAEIILDEEGNQEQEVSKSKRTDPAWQFFDINKEKKEWNCLIKTCQQTFKYTTECPSANTANKHLKTKHPKEFKIVEEERNKIAAAGPTVKKRKIDDPKQQKLTFASAKKYSKDNPKQLKFNESIIFYCCKPNVTIYQLKSDEFRGLDIDPIAFWLEADSKWNALKEYAIQTLSIPATSAAQERIFSYAGIATEKRRNRMGSELLNQKLFIHLNKKKKAGTETEFVLNF